MKPLITIAMIIDKVGAVLFFLLAGFIVINE
jgi:hypothetical protein